MEITRTKNGNRALVFYLCAPQVDALEEIADAVEWALAENNVGEVEQGATIRDELTEPQSVEIFLAEEGFQRSIRVGKCEGDILASVWFCEQPPAVDDEGEEESEPLNLPGVVCDALAEHFPRAKFGASSFVIQPDQRVFDYVVFEHD